MSVVIGQRVFLKIGLVMVTVKEVMTGVEKEATLLGGQVKGVR